MEPLRLALLPCAGACCQGVATLLCRHPICSGITLSLPLSDLSVACSAFLILFSSSESSARSSSIEGPTGLRAISELDELPARKKLHTLLDCILYAR